jgi:hypothetical protein
MFTKLSEYFEFRHFRPHYLDVDTNEQKERLCLINDKCRRQKLCKRAQKISAAAPLRVMASRYNPCE